MGFHRITCDLGDNFSIVANQQANQVQISVYMGETKIGHAMLVTDFVDTECITQFELDDAHVGHRFSNTKTLGEAFVKFLIKYPSVVRKPEFRFFIAVPESLLPIVEERYHFEHKNDAKILVRNNTTLPEECTTPEGITFTTTTTVSEEVASQVLDLLKSNAYWQSHLTEERLALLLQSSQCVLAFRDEELVGFARILTDNEHFASLWDVVVKAEEQRQGIGNAMMFHIFSDPTYSSVPNWLLFTDTARGLYEKFGFVEETAVTGPTPYHKLRLQEEPPPYMLNSINHLRHPSCTLSLDSTRSHAHLFEVKRADLVSFFLPAGSQPQPSAHGDDVGADQSEVAALSSASGSV